AALPRPLTPSGGENDDEARTPGGVRASCGVLTGPVRPGPARSLEGDRGAGALEGSLGLLGRLLVRALQDRLRGTVHEVLGLLQAEGRERAHLLDDLDLLVAGGLEDDVELVLLLLGRGVARATRGGGDRDGGGGGGGDLEGL